MTDQSTDRLGGSPDDEFENDEFEEDLEALDPDHKTADEIANEATPPTEGPAAPGSMPG